MKTAIWIGLLLGLLGLGLLVAWQGAAEIAAHFGSADWAIVLVVLFALPDLLFSALAWWQVLPRHQGRPPPVRFRDSVVGMWMGTSVNLLLPVATIGGEAVKARYLKLRGMRGSEAAASVFLDKTVQALSIALWALVGLIFLLPNNPPPEMVLGVVLGAGLLLAGVTGFVWVQVSSPFGFVGRRVPLGREGEKPGWLASLVNDAEHLDRSIRALYGQPWKVAAATLLRLLARVSLAGEVWLAAWLMGLPVGPGEAILLKSLSMALRAAAFVVPGGLGLQEGVFVAIGLLIGLPPDAMLSLSLAGRLRELAAALPGLLLWQLVEGKAALGRKDRQQA